jgi:signal transduction histidine kinase
MRYQHKLRFRIFLSYPVLGLLISLIVIVFFWFSFEQLEQQLSQDFLTEELEHFIELTQKNPAVTQQIARNWAAYKIDPNQPSETLPSLKGYVPGLFEITLNNKHYDVVVMEKHGYRYYILHDESDFRVLEKKLMIYVLSGTLMIICAATWYGIWLSKKVMLPIITLANQVKNLDRENVNTSLGSHYANDEVGFLAQEFDVYLNHIHLLIAREREFTANASHELRTPLAVIMAVTESLLMQQDLPEKIRPKLQRIERSAKEMKNRLEVLLTLARNPENETELKSRTELAPLIDNLLEDHANLLKKSVRLEKLIHGQPVVSAPYTIISMLLSNLIKNALSYTDHGSILIQADNKSFSITDTGRGIPDSQLVRIFERGVKSESSQGLGLGLSIVQRITEHYNWRLDIKSTVDKGTTIILFFNN